MKPSFADILAGLDGDRARKLARKLPEWAAAGAEVPSALSLEQCSSSLTARYKAQLASEQIIVASRGGSSPRQNFASLIPPTASQRVPPVHEATGGHGFAGATSPDVPQDNTGDLSVAPLFSTTKGIELVLDLTGGLGVDSWAFSQVAERVVYYERDAELAAAAERNFALLGAAGVEVRCETVTPESVLPEADLIYADPARRDAAGRKVFLLEDCTPDILTLLPMLLRKAPAVLLKLSPMADLSMLRDRLGPALQQIHVVEADGEVKELLCLLVAERLSAGQAPRPGEEIVLASLRKCPPGASCAAGNASILRFQTEDERNAKVVYAAGVQPGDVLLEPCPALLKAGAFRLPCERWGLRKLAPSTHLYLPSDSTSDNPFFKEWRISDALPLGAAAFRELKRRCPRAEITARNLPLGSDALRKRMGIAPGGDNHIFGCRLADGSAVLLVCEAVS